MQAWGFTYKSNVVWHKIRKDGGSDGRGVGFYFRNVTELILFGVRGKNARTLAPGRSQVNMIRLASASIRASPMSSMTSSKLVQPGPTWSCSPRGVRKGWATWGNQADDSYVPTWKTYAHHSQAARGLFKSYSTEASPSSISFSRPPPPARQRSRDWPAGRSTAMDRDFRPLAVPCPPACANASWTPRTCLGQKRPTTPAQR